MTCAISLPPPPPPPPVLSQRDFGLYVVNLFDTGQAARVLSLPSAGLAFLLDHYCGVKVWICVDRSVKMMQGRQRVCSDPSAGLAESSDEGAMWRAKVTSGWTPPENSIIPPLPPPPLQADKRYQLADWRVRPLSPEMMHYARSDTHYLLYIHDRLKAELTAGGFEVRRWGVARGEFRESAPIPVAVHSWPSQRGAAR